MTDQPPVDPRYVAEADRTVAWWDARLGPDGSEPDPGRWTAEARQATWRSVLADVHLVGELARTLATVDGLEAHAGAGDSPGMRAAFASRTADPADDGYRRDGVKAEFLQLGAVDGVGYAWIRADDDEGWQLAGGVLVVDGAAVTPELFLDDVSVRDGVLDVVRQVGEAFRDGDVAAATAVPGFDHDLQAVQIF